MSDGQGSPRRAVMRESIWSRRGPPCYASPVSASQIRHLAGVLPAGDKWPFGDSKYEGDAPPIPPIPIKNSGTPKRTTGNPFRIFR